MHHKLFFHLALPIVVLPTFVFAQTGVSGSAPTIVSTVAPASPIMPIRACPYEGVSLRQGVSGEEVKALQSLLAEDTTVYPEGLKTGYYGSLTAEAVKRLQSKYDLPKTGAIDNDTREVIFPCATLRVLSPNGGEVWSAGETQNITWEVDAPIYFQNFDKTLRPARVEERSIAVPSTIGAIMPYYPHLSIDLVRTDVGVELQTFPPIRKGEVVYHIGGASLYGDRSFKWTIPRSIPVSRSYKIRISVWKNVPEPYDCKMQPCPLGAEAYPRPWLGYLWDESDSEFAIVGGGIVPTPGPSLDELLLLQRQIQALSEQLRGMNDLVQKMQDTISSIIRNIR